MRGSPRPSKDQILAALEANGGNAKKTALQLGIPRSTLRYMVGRMGQHTRGKVHKGASAEKVSDLAGQWKRVADKGTALALAAMERISPEELKARDVKDLLVGSAVATEKHQLLTGQATQRQENVRISLVGAADLRALSAQMARAALPAGDVVEGAYTETSEVA